MKNLLKILLFFFIIVGAVSCGNKFSPPPQYYAPVVPYRYDNFNKPYSRSYQNPYSNPPGNYYPYYDADYYYVAPRQNNPFDANDNQVRGSNFDINNK